MCVNKHENSSDNIQIFRMGKTPIGFR